MAHAWWAAMHLFMVFSRKYFAIFINDNRQQNIMESMKSMKHAIVSTYFKLKTTYNTEFISLHC